MEALLRPAVRICPSRLRERPAFAGLSHGRLTPPNLHAVQRARNGTLYGTESVLRRRFIPSVPMLLRQRVADQLDRLRASEQRAEQARLDAKGKLTGAW